MREDGPMGLGATRAWRTARPSAATLQWAEETLGGGTRIVRIRPLHGGLSHATHRLDMVRAGRTSSVVLRRWARPQWRETDPTFTASHEAACLRLVEQAAIPAPRLLGVDADATMCDAPAVLQ